MQPNNRSVLMIGNFLSKRFGTRSVSEDLRDQLVTQKWIVLTTSSYTNRIARIINMLFVTWRYCHFYNVVTIEVYSGLAFWWAYTVAFLLRLLKKPYILNLHGGNLPDFSQNWHKQVQSFLNTAKFVTTPSQYLASELSWTRPDIILLRNAINLSSYEFKQRRHVEPKLAWLRAFHYIYNPTMAAKALALLINDFPQAELTMFGPDKGDGSLQVMQTWACEAEVDHHITLPGFIPKVAIPNALSRHDIFINTTTAESFGVSVMEAAALGMCIVTTNVGELSYIWTHEYDAMLVPLNDSQAMADAIRRILNEPDLAERLSRNARVKAEQFDWSVILPQWQTLLIDVIEKHQSD